MGYSFWPNGYGQPAEEYRSESRAGNTDGSGKGQRKTRRRETGGLAYQPLAHPEIFRGGFAAVFLLFVADLGTLIEVAQASSFHGRDVYKHVFAACIGLNKSKSLSRVEPLHSTCRHVRTPF
jgi:hypothetical protein